MIENHANNKLEFLYMDESGDLGYKHRSRFFVIAVIKLSNRRELELYVKRFSLQWLTLLVHELYFEFMRTCPVLHRSQLDNTCLK